MILGQADALHELARIWEDDAGRVQRWDPSDPKVRVLRECARELRRVLGESAPEWVSIRAVQAWTGWAPQTIRRRCREEWGPRQEARKGSSGEWELAFHVARSLPQRGLASEAEGGDGVETADLGELARLVGRDG